MAHVFHSLYTCGLLVVFRPLIKDLCPMGAEGLPESWTMSFCLATGFTSWSQLQDQLSLYVWALLHNLPVSEKTCRAISSLRNIARWFSGTCGRGLELMIKISRWVAFIMFAPHRSLLLYNSIYILRSPRAIIEQWFCVPRMFFLGLEW